MPSTNPELIEGPWETTGASGIDGIFLTIETGSNWQTINIRVYHHRDKGKESWGYFATNENATTEWYKMQDDHSFTLFNGTHLRIHFVDVTDLKPFDLDLTFSPGSYEWSGTWSRPRETSNVVLRRPNPSPMSLQTHLWVIGRLRPANPISRQAASTFGSLATGHFLPG